MPLGPTVGPMWNQHRAPRPLSAASGRRRVLSLTALVVVLVTAAACPPPDNDEPLPEPDPDTHAQLVAAVRAATWTAMPGAPTISAGKQDDIFFVDDDVGFAVGGPLQTVSRTKDGGATWQTVLDRDDTFFRSLLFVNEAHGFVGNLGGGLSPSLSDPTIMYETLDGGDSWAAVDDDRITGSTPSGLCNFTSIDETHLIGVGRVSGPAHMLTSNDAGATWTSVDLSAHFSMLIDAHFSSSTEGVLAGMDPSGRTCRIARTVDGGATFTPVFTSITNSLCWKLNFPTPAIGYAAIQQTGAGPGTFAKTVDGGATWEEFNLPPLADPDEGYPAIGIGFISDRVGWVVSEDAALPAYRTFDGGETWEVDEDLRAPINRFRVVNNHTVVASGGTLWRLDLDLP